MYSNHFPTYLPWVLNFGIQHQHPNLFRNKIEKVEKKRKERDENNRRKVCGKAPVFGLQIVGENPTYNNIYSKSLYTYDVNIKNQCYI